MDRFNGRGMRVRHSKNHENIRHVPDIMETSLTRTLVFTNISFVLSFNNTILSTYYIPGVILVTGNTAVNKTDNASGTYILGRGEKIKIN